MATFADFIFECQNYEHSQEHYELMKECSEVALMDQYLENQNFIMNLNESYEVEDGYFSEAAGSDTLQDIYEAAEAKKASIWSKIKKKIIKIWTIVLNFFKRLGSTLGKKDYDSVILTKRLKAMDISELLDVVNNINTDNEYLNKITPELARLIVTKNSNILSANELSACDNDDKLKAILIIAKASKILVLPTALTNDRCVNIETGIKALKTYNIGKLDGVASNKIIESAIKLQKENDGCMTIAVARLMNNKTIEDLQKLIAELGEKFSNRYADAVMDNLEGKSDINLPAADTIIRLGGDLTDGYNKFIVLKKAAMAAVNAAIPGKLVVK